MVSVCIIHSNGGIGYVPVNLSKGGVALVCVCVNYSKKTCGLSVCVSIQVKEVWPQCVCLCQFQ